MKFIAAAILSFSVFICFAQTTPLPLHFIHLKESNRLSNNTIRSIYCDSRGFMWIGTNDGLNRFDGSSFTSYRNNNFDTTSISGNDINHLFEDDNGNLWVSAHCRGLSKFNLYNHKSYNYYADGKEGSLQGNCDLNVVQDVNGNIWVCNQTVISELNKNGKTFSSYKIFNSSNKSFIHNIAISKNTIWLSHVSGLRSYNIASKKITDYDTLVDNATCGNIKIAEGDLLVCTWKKGLYIFDNEMKKKRRLFNGSIVNDAAIISLTGRKQLWIATTEGLYVSDIDKDLFSLRESSFTLYKNNPSDPYSLSDNNVSCIYFDSSKNNAVWLGTSSGVNVLTPSYLTFKSVVVSKNNHPLETTQLNNILKEKDEKGATIYWLSYWHGSGLLQTDSSFRIKKQIIIKDENGKPAIVSNVIRGKDGYLWMATWDGLKCYDDKHDRFISSFNKNGPGKIHLSTDHLDYVMQDSKGRFWIGTYWKGLNLVNFEDSSVIVFKTTAKPHSLFEDRSDFIYEDRKGRIWIAGTGLQLYREATKDFKLYLPKPGDTTSLPGNVNSIFEDKRHQLWIATNEGLALYNEEKDAFHSFTSKDGLPGDECETITEDSGNNLWITTSGGLCSINIKNFVISSYTTDDGLPDNRLGNVIFTNAAGNISFSLQTANSPFISFDPATLQSEKKNIPFHFTSVNILGKDQLFDKPVEALKNLQLTYQQNVFSISFKALDYDNSANIRYKYILEGFDRNWVDLNHQNNVTFTNLDGGTYTLRVKATDASGVWLDKELHLIIVVQPPFWRTWWFYATCFIVVALVIYIIFIQRIKHVRKEEKKNRLIDNEMADLKMKALKAQINPHFIFNSLSSIQESIVTRETDTATKYLGKFSRLIRMVLDFSDASFISLQQEVEYLQLYLELEAFRFQNFHFQLIIQPCIDAGFIKIPPMLVQPFVENAIKHGLSHKDGEKNISVVFEELNENSLKVMIDDNGIGRRKAAAININRKFSYQSKGMKITSGRLDLMQKKESCLSVIDKTDSEGNSKGTTIILSIPSQANQ